MMYKGAVVLVACLTSLCIAVSWSEELDANARSRIRTAVTLGFRQFQLPESSQLQFHAIQTGSRKTGDAVSREWLSETLGRAYEDKNRAAVIVDISTQESRNGRPIPELRQHRHAFWDGTLGFNHQIASGGEDAYGLNVATVRHTADYSKQVHKYYHDGVAFDQLASGETENPQISWDSLFEAAFEQAEITTRNGTPVVRFSKGVWSYEVVVNRSGDEFSLGKITAEKLDDPSDQRQYASYTLTPLEYSDAGGVRFVSKSKFEEIAIFRNGESLNNSITMSRTDVHSASEQQLAEFFLMDAPDGTVVQDMTYPGIQYVAAQGKLDPSYSQTTVSKIIEDIDELTEAKADAKAEVSTVTRKPSESSGAQASTHSSRSWSSVATYGGLVLAGAFVAVVVAWKRVRR